MASLALRSHEMAPCKVRVYAVAASGLLLPQGCEAPMLQCRVVRTGRRKTVWPWFCTAGSKGALWLECEWERLVSEVVVEMALDEAEEDMSEAIAEHERKLEEERQRKLAEERRREEERQRALRFKKMVNAVATKSVNKILGATTPWLSTLIHNFRMFDKDDSGDLSAIELIAALRTLGISKKVQDGNAGITELVTRMRRHAGEITLKQFVEDMPKEVYDAIRLHGDKDQKAMDERRKVMGIIKGEGVAGPEKLVRNSCEA